MEFCFGENNPGLSFNADIYCVHTQISAPISGLILISMKIYHSERNFLVKNFLQITQRRYRDLSVPSFSPGSSSRIAMAVKRCPNMELENPHPDRPLKNLTYTTLSGLEGQLLAALLR